MKKISAFLVIFMALLAFPAPGYASNNPYYASLRERCEKTAGDAVGCCLASVKAMEAGGYKEAMGTNYTQRPDGSDERCPKGYKANMYKCITSYVWCEPVANKN